MCFILISNHIQNFAKVKENVNKLVDLYAKDPIGFYYVDGSKYPDFGLKFENSKAVLFKYKRNKFSIYNGEDFKSFIDNVLSGNGRFKRLMGELNFDSTLKEDL